MGNRHGRSKSASDADQNDVKRRNKRGDKKNKDKASPGESRADKVTSCPDLGGAVPYKGQDEVDLNLTLYRSYAAIPDSRTDLRDGEPEYKIYRRSTSGLPSSKTMSLPRSFGRKRGVSEPVSNGTLKAYPELRNRRLAYDLDSPESGRTSMTSSATSLIGSKVPVTPSDFPNTAQIKKRLEQFENAFVSRLKSKFTKLPQTLQLSSIPVAIHTESNNQHTYVSLFDYLDTQIVPLDLTSNLGVSREYSLVIPSALFHGTMHIRRDKIADRDLWTSLARDLAMYFALDGANELSRMFEYQIALLNEEASVKTLASYAASCVIGYLRNNNCYLDRNTVVLGAIRGLPVEGDGNSGLISVILGNRELKWYVDEVFKKPSLRKEMYLFTDDLEIDDEHPPWQFQTSDNCNPMLYGYRGLLVEWDYVKGIFKLNVDDEKSFDEEMSYRYDDFHRMYCPYRRLIGVNVMMDYCQQRKRGATDMSLAQFVRHSAGPALYGRDEVQPVYRPLANPDCLLQLQGANLDNSDLSHMQLAGTDLTGSSVRNSRLLSADVQKTNMAQTNAGGADFSYSNLDGAKMKPETLRAVKVTHVTMSRPQPPPGTEAGPAGRGQTDNRTMISDAKGQVVQVDNAIANKKKEVEEEKRRAAEETISSSPSPTRIVVREKRSEPNAKKIRKKKKVVSKSVSDVGAYKAANGHSEFTEIPVQRVAVTAVKTAPPPQRDTSKGATLPRSTDSHTIKVEVEPHVRPQSAAGVESSPRAISASYIDNNDRSALLRHPPKEGGYHRRQGARSAAYPGQGRMVKSVSHHGELPGSGRSGPLSTYAEGYYQGRRIPSYAEVEYIRRSQVFNMIRGLQIRNIDSNLPDGDPILMGRTQDVDSVVDMASDSGRVVTVTGPWGVGKSALALTVARELQAKFILPVLVELRGCGTTSSVIRRIMHMFGLHFRQKELKWFYNWLNCREQRFLFVLDNLDLKPEEDGNMSDFIDDAMFHVKNLRILCTSRRSFFRGQSNSESYRLGNIEKRSEDVLRQLVPDLHDEGIAELASVCSHMPLALRLLGKVFALDDIDTGSLFEELTVNKGHPLMSKIQEEISKVTHDEFEQQCLTKVTCCIVKCLDVLPGKHKDLLTKLAYYPSFSRTTAIAAMSADDSEEETEKSENMLRLLIQLGLVNEIGQEAHFAFNPCVMLIAKASVKDVASQVSLYQQDGLTAVHKLVEVYHSHKAMEAEREFTIAYDFIEDVLWRVIEREEVYDTCERLATLDGAIFLSGQLSEHIYVTLFESLEQQAQDRGDKILEVRALCCLAYRFISDVNVRHASSSVQKAYEIVHKQPETIGETDRAFTLFCLGKLYWMDVNDRNQAQVFVKRALDIFKRVLGMKHLHTLYAYELYGWMLTQTDNFQTARHFYNVSDFMAKEMLEDHPELISGYDSRRAIWDKLSLFARATDAAAKAAKISEDFWGEHPLTATMMANHCESIIKRGSLNEAIRAAVSALSIRVKVLGDHLDTAASYKEMAYLMLRSGQYDEAVRFSQNALDIYDKLDASESLKIETRNLMAQARYRLEYRSSLFVQLESKDGGKKKVKETLNTSTASSPPQITQTSVSTEV